MPVDRVPIGMIRQRRMKDLADVGMCAQECRDLRRGGRSTRMRFACAIECRRDRSGPAPVEDAAAHGDEIHHRVRELRIVGRDVAPHVAIVAAKRLAAGDDNVDAVGERVS